MDEGILGMPFQKGHAPANKGQKRAATTPPAPKIEDSTAIGQMLDLLKGMSGRLEVLEAKVQEQDRAIPKFKQSAPVEGVKQPKPDLTQIKGVGQQVSGGKDILTSIDGLRMDHHPHVFNEGSAVRLNPDCEQGRALKINGKDPAQYVGTIVGFHFVDKNFETKYRVDFPGLTRGTRGDGFRESDLLSV